jgi:hypothetical protein
MNAKQAPPPTENAIKIPPSKPMTTAVATTQPANDMLAANDGHSGSAADLKSVKPTSRLRKCGRREEAEKRPCRGDATPPQSGRQDHADRPESDRCPRSPSPGAAETDELKRYGEIADRPTNIL